MAFSSQQKKWAIGGGIGALALAIGYGLFHHKPTPQRQYQIQPPSHHKRKKHEDHHDDQAERGDRGDHRENGRGEHHHRHGGHKHG